MTFCTGNHTHCLTIPQSLRFTETNVRIVLPPCSIPKMPHVRSSPGPYLSSGAVTDPCIIPRWHYGWTRCLAECQIHKGDTHVTTSIQLDRARSDHSGIHKPISHCPRVRRAVRHRLRSQVVTSSPIAVQLRLAVCEGWPANRPPTRLRRLRRTPSFAKRHSPSTGLPSVAKRLAVCEGWCGFCSVQQKILFLLDETKPRHLFRPTENAAHA